MDDTTVYIALGCFVFFVAVAATVIVAYLQSKRRK